MPARRVHTKEFSVEARARLGLAITRAREASGHPYRPSFAREVGLSVRSIVNIESGKPVGASVYEAVARGLPGWDENTPQAILGGSPAPDVSAAPAAPSVATHEKRTENVDEFEFWERLRRPLADQPEMFNALFTLYLRHREAQRQLAERSFPDRKHVRE